MITLYTIEGMGDMYPYFYNGYLNPPLYHSGGIVRNDQEAYQQTVKAVQTSIQREASALDFYNRLANAAPNENHKTHMVYMIESKKAHLNQFTDLYRTLTGGEPRYEIKKIHFHNYREGLQKAYEIEAACYQDYENAYSRSLHPFIQHVFLWALTNERENAVRFETLKNEGLDEIKDYGTKPFVVNIEEVTTRNNTYRTSLWTGKKLQVTVMSIEVGDDIGLEVHPTTDQFIRIEEGEGLVQMGDSKDQLNFEKEVYDDYAIMIPAGKWHNVVNTGNIPMKLYAIYAPPEHPYGTVHETKAEAIASEENGY